jgi:C_GCAxxG_C_C family probable redox protein
MDTPTQKALARFDEHFNCSQSVFSAFAEQLGFPDEIALKLASPFGGGLSRRGEVCGAVAGALLALGVARGNATPAGKDETYRLGQEFMRRFEARHHAIRCRDLIICDISTPEGYQKATEKGVFRTICPVLVRDAVEIVQAVMEGRQDPAAPAAG